MEVFKIMRVKDIEKFLIKTNDIITSYEDKLKVLDYNYFVISNIIFTSKTEYYYLFNVFKDNKVIEQISITNTKDYNKVFKELSVKYKTNIIYNYNDLSYKQLKYLDSLDDTNINKDEINNLIFKKQLEIV